VSERDDLLAGIDRCQRRVLHLEKWIGKLLEAWGASEHGNVDEALDHLRKAMSRV
jgi:hypothetical protein